MAFSSWFSNKEVKQTLQDELKELKEVVQNQQEQIDTLQTKLDEKTKYTVMFYHDGTLYQGEVNENKTHGFGTIFYSNGTRYMGEWKDGLYHGKGTLYRDYYSPPFYGEWKEHVPHGKCSYDGIVYETYEDGVCVNFS